MRKIEKAQQIEKWDFYVWSISFGGRPPPMKKIEKSKNVKELILINIQKKLNAPLYNKEI